MRKLEQEFKTEIIDLWKKAKTFKYVFCIETEETEPGFPDVMAIREDNTCAFFEFKVTNKKGKMKFERSQPVFYMRHKEMEIHLFVYDNSSDRDRFYDVPICKVLPHIKNKLEVYTDEILNC